MWRERYLRFCAETYALDDVSNAFTHLSNNAVAAHSPAHKTQALGEREPVAPGKLRGAATRSARAERGDDSGRERAGRARGRGRDSLGLKRYWYLRYYL